MVRENGFIFTLIVNFILFLSLIPVVFNLSGKIGLIEAIAAVVLIIIAIILTVKVAKLRPRVWKGLFIFYGINLLNLLFIYARTLVLKPLILPLMVSYLGLIVAVIKIKPAEDDEEPVEIKTYEEKKIYSIPVILFISPEFFEC